MSNINKQNVGQRSPTSDVQNRNSPKQPRYRSYLKCVLITMVFSLCGFYFGYCISYFAVLPFDKVVEVYGITMKQSVAQGILVGAVPIGGTIGALVLSPIQRKISPRVILIMVNLLGVLFSSLIMVHNQILLFTCRIGQGVCAGFFISLGPMIIMQLAPIQISGTMGSIFQLLSTIAAFSSFLLQYVLSSGFNLQFEQYVYAIYSIPLAVNILQLIGISVLFPFQTPQYFIHKKLYDQAKITLKQIYKPEYVEQVFQQKMQDVRNLNAIISYQEPQTIQSQQNFVQQQDDLLKTSLYDYNQKRARKITRFMAVSLAILQNVSGVNIVLGYAPPLVKSIFPDLAQLIPVLINLEVVLGTVVSGLLLSKFGRKQIFQCGTFANALSLLMLAVGFILNQDADTKVNKFPGVLIIIGLFCTMGSFAVSLGPLVWLYIPQIVNSKFVSFASTINCFSAVITMVLFPIIVQALPNQNPFPVFLFLTVWCFLAFLVNQRIMVETKGKTETQIQIQYSRVKYI